MSASASDTFFSYCCGVHNSGTVLNVRFFRSIPLAATVGNCADFSLVNVGMRSTTASAL